MPPSSGRRVDPELPLCRCRPCGMEVAAVEPPRRRREVLLLLSRNRRGRWSCRGGDLRPPPSGGPRPSSPLREAASAAVVAGGSYRRWLSLRNLLPEFGRSRQSCVIVASSDVNEITMISSRRLAQMARKWLQRAAAAGRKRIAFHAKTAATEVASDACSTSAPARKGHFVVYSSDGRRYEMPLTYLKNDIVMELLRISEEVIGLPGDGPITLPWDAAVVGSVVSSLRSRSSRDAERAVLAAMASRFCQDSMGPCSLVNHRLLVDCQC